ncbi:hypothetical protein OTSKATO_0541 [Orientia tsutsugamushi str. Kato PP]|uniref:Uncharacterized protein n=1 Tax=Orientia tsutsugamushi TaxID=784 RepID=A0A2U3REF8_ORITS|nr:hypothetical protein OTSKATO_0541 [Orientia tsutsugamushi str. Kato PP]SPR11587.1 Uncharacterised protein [Orientia tsutsugamushi]
MQILCYFFKKGKKYSFYEHNLQTNVTITILKLKKTMILIVRLSYYLTVIKTPKINKNK